MGMGTCLRGRPQPSKQPRLDPGAWVAPPVDDVEVEEDDPDLPDLVEDGPLEGEARREAIRRARKHARDSLVPPRLLEWAQELREEAEATWLTDVDSLFAAPDACPNSETHRYATLMAMHPGAQFHKALLKADEEEELLLSKAPPPPSHCMIGQVWNIPGIFHTLACISQLLDDGG